MRRHAPLVLALIALAALVGPAAVGQVNVANNAAELSGRTILLAEVAHTITASQTFDLDPGSPFIVTSGSSKVANLDADKLDALDSTRFYWASFSNANTGTQNDWAPGITTGQPTIARETNATLLTITGIAGGVDGQHLKILALGAGTIELAHQNAGSVVGNRIITPTSGSLILTAGTGYATLMYDGTTARWRVLDSTPTMAMVRICTNSGSHAGTGAAVTIDTCAITGLVASDTLQIEATLESVTQATATPIFRNETDPTTLSSITTGGANIPIAGISQTTTHIRQRQAGPTKIATFVLGVDPTAAVMTTNTWNTVTVTNGWTGAWSLGLRTGGTTVGGTLQWSWTVYRLM